MDSLRKLEEMFAHFPGIGPRQARRFVYYLLNKSPSYIKEFTKLIEDVKNSTSECASCHRIFLNPKSKFQNPVCSVCADASRDHAILMIVARDSDYESIEKSGAYTGLYFILGGTVPVLDKEPEKRIRIRSLLERVSAAGSLKEVILSLNTTPDGEHTENIVREALMKLMETGMKHPVKISILGRGLSTGAELEYVDGETIRNALENRH
jgi:recombination protein RecR